MKRAYYQAEFRELKNRVVSDINMRLRLMKRYNDVLQVIAMVLSAIEALASIQDAAELTKIANDELAEIVAKYPDKFVAAVAALPMNNINAALVETDRAITQLKPKGVQVCANRGAEPLNSPSYHKLYEKMAQYNIPIWIHPYSIKGQPVPLFIWAYKTPCTMMSLVSVEIFNDFPDLKFITHHAGGVVLYLASRMEWMMPLVQKGGHKVKYPADHFKKLYGDTALYGNTAGLICANSFFGSGHLLFVTDEPLGPEYGLTMETIESINRMNITESENDLIFRGNTTKLLRIAA